MIQIPGYMRQDNNQSGVTDLEIFSQNPTRSIFVRDLPYFCCSTDLAKFFQSCLQVPILHAVVCKNKKRRTLQFGCVMFESEDHVRLAVELMNGKRFVGRDIRVMVYDTNAPLEASTTGLIHVSFKALSPQCPLITEAVIRSCFDIHGDIEHVSIRSHKYSEAGMQGGYGFLTFRTPEQNKMVVDRVRQTIMNDILYDCSWSESHTQKVLGAEGAADFRLQESKILGGRPTTRSVGSRPPVAMHDGMQYLPGSVMDSHFRAPTGRVGYPGGDVGYDPRYPSDPRLDMNRGRFPVSDRDVYAQDYAMRGANEYPSEYQYRSRGQPPMPPYEDPYRSQHPSYGQPYPHNPAYVRGGGAPVHSRPLPSGYDPRYDSQTAAAMRSANLPHAPLGYDDYDSRYGRLPMTGYGGNPGAMPNYPQRPGPADYEDASRYRSASVHSTGTRGGSFGDDFGVSRYDRGADMSMMYGGNAGSRVDPRYDLPSRSSGFDSYADEKSFKGNRSNLPYNDLDAHSSMRGVFEGGNSSSSSFPMAPSASRDPANLSKEEEMAARLRYHAVGAQGLSLGGNGGYGDTSASRFPAAPGRTNANSFDDTSRGLPGDFPGRFRDDSSYLSASLSQLQLDEYGLPRGRPAAPSTQLSVLTAPHFEDSLRDFRHGLTTGGSSNLSEISPLSNPGTNVKHELSANSAFAFASDLPPKLKSHVSEVEKLENDSGNVVKPMGGDLFRGRASTESSVASGLPMFFMDAPTHGAPVNMEELGGLEDHPFTEESP